MDPLAVVLIHDRENRRKCSLEPLRGDPRLAFVRFRPGLELDAAGATVLDVAGAPLTPADAGRRLLLLDSTWRLLPALRAALRGDFVCRSLPRALRTAYPRRSVLFPDPDGGLASVEALYAAWRLLGHRDDSLLDGYRGKEEFLRACDAAGLP